MEKAFKIFTVCVHANMLYAFQVLYFNWLSWGGKKGEGFACMERTLFNSRDDPIPPPLEARAK